MGMTNPLIDSLVSIIEQRPEDHPLREHLAELLIAEGRGTEAVSHLAVILAVDPHNERVAGLMRSALGVPEAPAPAAPEQPAPRKARKRRAVASTGVVEPDAAPAPIVIDLPARAQTSEPAAPTRSTADIQLPEASDQPRVKRRRRAVSTGIVDAG